MRKWRWLAITEAALLATSALWIWTPPPPPQIRPNILEMTAIDVGQGDSILLILPEGRKVLVEAGGLPFWAHSQLDIGEDVVSPYLWSRGMSRVDVLALTHAHADHMGGMPAVMANCWPREFWLPQGIPDDEIRKLLSEAHELGIAVVYRHAGDPFSYGGAMIRVLAPAHGQDSHASTKGDTRRNDESLVMNVSYGKTSALLEADAEKLTENFVCRRRPCRRCIEGLAHHGGASSTNAKLLAAVHPRFAVISVGIRNVYRYPRAEVLSRLQQAEVLTYRTDIGGATSFFLDGTGVTSQVADLH